MKIKVLLLLALLSVSAFESMALIVNSNFPAENIELLLISGPECNTCEGFTHAHRKKHDDDVLYIEGQGYPIKRVDKLNLPQGLAIQFAPQTLAEKNWPHQLTVAVVDNGELLYQGDIIQSRGHFGDKEGGYALEYFIEQALLFDRTRPNQ